MEGPKHVLKQGTEKSPGESRQGQEVKPIYRYLSTDSKISCHEEWCCYGGTISQQFEMK